jgi:hypothetical protein
MTWTPRPSCKRVWTPSARAWRRTAPLCSSTSATKTLPRHGIVTCTATAYAVPPPALSVGQSRSVSRTYAL